jgi:hypothetical protein
MQLAVVDDVEEDVGGILEFACSRMSPTPRRRPRYGEPLTALSEVYNTALNLQNGLDPGRFSGDSGTRACVRSLDRERSLIELFSPERAGDDYPRMSSGDGTPTNRSYDGDP